METNIKLRDFTESDWLGLAGAERPAEGIEPKIGDIKVDGQDAMVVVDRNGIQVMMEDARTFGLVMVYPAARAFVGAVLVPEMELDQLRMLGFEQWVG